MSMEQHQKYMSKYELAMMAGVSPRTFSRYLRSRREVLRAMGVTPRAHLLPPKAVKFICEDFSIEW